MQEDRPNIEDDLDLDETAGAGLRGIAVDDTSANTPELSVDDDDEIDEVESSDAIECAQEAAEDCGASPTGSVECTEDGRHDDHASQATLDSAVVRRLDVQRIRGGLQQWIRGGLQQWIREKSARVSGIVPHPLVAVGVAMLVGGGIYEISGGEEDTAKPPPPAARVVSGGFETPDFRMADKGSITERQAAATLAQHRAEHSAGEDTRHQCASGTMPDARETRGSAGTDPKGLLYTEQQMQQAVARARQEALEKAAARGQSENSRRGRDRGRRRHGATRARRSVSVPSGAETETGEENRSLPAYLVGFPDEEAKDAPEVPKIDLPVGTRIPAVLDLGISSARHGTAVARTTAAVVDATGRKIPAGSVLTGRSSSSNERVYLDFTMIRVGSETFQLRAVGSENEDLGLLAERVEAPMSERTASRLADGALGAVRGLAAAGGGMVGRVVSQATGGVINEAQREQRVDRSVTLKVAAGTPFVVVVTG